MDGKNVMSTIAHGIPPPPQKKKKEKKRIKTNADLFLFSLGCKFSSHMVPVGALAPFFAVGVTIEKLQQRRTVDLSANISVALHCSGLTRAPLPHTHTHTMILTKLKHKVESSLRDKINSAHDTCIAVCILY